MNLCIRIPELRIYLGKFVVLILPFKESAVGMASYRQQFAKHLRQIRIFRTGAQKNISNKGAILRNIFIGGDKVR
jgi:hypothetical protein